MSAVFGLRNKILVDSWKIRVEDGLVSPKKPAFGVDISPYNRKHSPPRLLLRLKLRYHNIFVATVRDSETHLKGARLWQLFSLQMRYFIYKRTSRSTRQFYSSEKSNINDVIFYNKSLWKIMAYVH